MHESSDAAQTFCADTVFAETDPSHYFVFAPQYLVFVVETCSESLTPALTTAGFSSCLQYFAAEQSAGYAAAEVRAAAGAYPAVGVDLVLESSLMVESPGSCSLRLNRQMKLQDKGFQTHLCQLGSRDIHHLFQDLKRLSNPHKQVT